MADTKDKTYLPPRWFLTPDTPVSSSSILHIASQSEAPVFNPRSPFDTAVKTAATGLAAGICYNTLKATISPGQMSPIQALTYGKIALPLTAAGFFYSYISVDLSNKALSSENTPLAATTGACAAGFIFGLRHGSLPSAVGTCAALGLGAGLYTVTGSTLTSNQRGLSREQKEINRLAAFEKTEI